MPIVHTIDLRYLDIAGAIACYVVVGDDGPVLVETGPRRTLDACLDGLAAVGVAPDDIRDVLITHIHLDHAGAAGWWAARGARIHVHAFGAPHLVDPSKLLASAQRIYGADMDRLWGELTPVPESLMHPLDDGDVVDAGGLRFRAIETPGHARHHHAFALDDLCFTGDAASMVVPRNGFIALPTPPPEFDLEAWLASIERLRVERFRILYLTHFGAITAVEDHLDRVAGAVRRHAAVVRDALDAGHDVDTIVAEYSAWYRRQADDAGCTDLEFRSYVSRHLLAMNVTGLIRYWTKRAAAATTPPDATGDSA